MLSASTFDRRTNLFDTNLAIVGNVLTAPEWRRLKDSGSLMANFRVASTARRFDREKAQWVDGNSLRVRVTAWRRLAEGVASSIAVGDPVVVYGRLYNRDYTDEHGKNRTSYEMEAFSIGHDLARGRAKFFRTRFAQITEVEASEAEIPVRGEQSVPLTADEAPVLYGDGLPDQLSEHEPTFADVAPGATPPASTSRSASPSSPPSTASVPSSTSLAASSGAPAPLPTSAASSPVSAPPSLASASPTPAAASAQLPETREAAASSEAAQPSDPAQPSKAAQPSDPAQPSEPGLLSPTAGEETDELTLEVERLVAEEQQPTPSRRRTRQPKREPVAA